MQEKIRKLHVLEVIFYEIVFSLYISQHIGQPYYANTFWDFSIEQKNIGIINKAFKHRVSATFLNKPRVSH